MGDARRILGSENQRETGDYIGVYRLERPLGRGGMGEVFLAHDDRLGRPVAIKRIRRQAAASEIDRERFRREARAAAKLNHPAITQIYDVVLDDTGDSIVMEYVDGRTLAEALAAGELDGTRASDVAVQVAEGLAEAHANGFVHRDLKSENVMVTAEGRAKILDFGLAKALMPEESAAGEDRSTLTEAGAVVGTFSTLSPEQAKGEAVDARSDLFSFGVLLYEMFTGHSPFRRRDRMASLRSVLAERPPPPRALRPELPAILSELIEELLSKDPDRRPASAGDVASRLRDSSDETAGLRPPEPAAEVAGVESNAATRSAVHAPAPQHERSSRPPDRREGALADRRRWRWLAIAALLIAAGAAAVLLRPREVLYVVVAPPELSGEVPGLVVAGVVDATLVYLHSLERVVTIDHSRSEIAGRSIEDLRREEAAGEVLRARIECPQATCWVSFSRLRGKERLGGVERFGIIEPEAHLTLADAVKARLADAYPDRRVRAGTPVLEVGVEDYTHYLELRQRLAAGQALDDQGFTELVALARRAPSFLAAVLLAADVARERGQADLASELVDEARELAPSDPRPLARRFDVELDDGRIEAAERTLEALADLAPGSERTLRARSRLLRATNRVEAAAEVARRLAQAHSSWYNLWFLADLELALDRRDEARAALDRLLTISPRNQHGLEKLAALETTFGDPAQAEQLFRRLLDLHPRGIYHSNLGWALYLQGRHRDAVDHYRQALAENPESAHRLLNLALAEEASGGVEAAREIYLRLSEQLDDDDVMKAQCLVRLGDASQAVKVATRALELGHESSNVRYQASQVFALAGERHSARAQIEILIERGWATSWFRIPAFESLAEDPAFEDLLRRSGAG